MRPSIEVINVNVLWMIFFLNCVRKLWTKNKVIWRWLPMKIIDRRRYEVWASATFNKNYSFAKRRQEFSRCWCVFVCVCAIVATAPRKTKHRAIENCETNEENERRTKTKWKTFADGMQRCDKKIYDVIYVGFRCFLIAIYSNAIMPSDDWLQFRVRPVRLYH